jgi:chromatin remodeling complex protein RSC6
MSNISTGTSTMSKNTQAPKRVSKKSETVATATPTPVPAPVATLAVEQPKPKKTKPTVASQATEVVPVATEVETVKVVETKSVAEEIASLISSNQRLRDECVSNVKTLQRLQKLVAREVKEAGRRRRRSKNDGNTEGKVRRPTIFTTPLTLKDELCSFLGLAKGSKMTPADVTRAFSAYVNSHNLKDVEKGHTIHPDAAMRKVLNVKEGESVTYRNIQKYLYNLYDLPEKKSATSS